MTAAVAATTTVTAQQQEPASYEVVSSFNTEAGRPSGGFQTRNGQFFGTTGGPDGVFSGGTVGTLFAMDGAGVRTTLHTFPAGTVQTPTGEGSPLGNLFEGADGSVYGTTVNIFESPIPPGQIYKIIQWQVNSGDNQAWTLEPAGARLRQTRRAAQRQGDGRRIRFDRRRRARDPVHASRRRESAVILRAVGATAAPTTTVSQR